MALGLPFLLVGTLSAVVLAVSHWWAGSVVLVPVAATPVQPDVVAHGCDAPDQLHLGDVPDRRTTPALACLVSVACPFLAHCILLLMPDARPRPAACPDGYRVAPGDHRIAVRDLLAFFLYGTDS